MDYSRAIATSRSRWAPLAAFAVVSSANQMAWLTFAPIATGAAHYYRTSVSTVGVLSEVFPLIYVLGAFPAARLLERSFRSWLAVGGILSGLGTFVRLGGAGRGGLPWLIAGQVLVAAAQPLLLNAVVILASRSLKPADRPTGIAIGSAGTFLGFVLAFVSGGALGAGHISALLVGGAVYAGLGAIALATALALTPELALAPDLVAAGLARLSGRQLWRELWADGVMRRLVCFVFVGFGVFVALVTWVQPLLQPAGVTTSTVDTLLTVMMLAGVASSLVLPPLLARWGAQFGFLIFAGVAAIAACILLAVAPGVTGAAVALVVTGLFLLPGMPVMLEVAERRGNIGAAYGAGLLWVAGNAGGIVVAGLVDGVQGTPWLSFSLLAVVIVLAVPAAFGLQGRLSSSTHDGHPADRGVTSLDAPASDAQSAARRSLEQ